MMLIHRHPGLEHDISNMTSRILYYATTRVASMHILCILSSTSRYELVCIMVVHNMYDNTSRNITHIILYYMLSRI